MSGSLGPKHLISHSIPLESKLSRRDSFFEKIRVFDFLEQITTNSFEVPRVIPKDDSDIITPTPPTSLKAHPHPQTSSAPVQSSVASTSNDQYRPALQNRDVVDALLRLGKNQTQSNKPANKSAPRPSKPVEVKDKGFERESQKTISYRIKHNRSFTNAWTTTPILTPYDDNDSN